jgi:hypothetical protein
MSFSYKNPSPEIRRCINFLRMKMISNAVANVAVFRLPICASSLLSAWCVGYRHLAPSTHYR